MSFLSGIIKELDNKYASMVEDGCVGDVMGFIDTGSYSLNAVISGSIYGGIPSNKITGLAGESQTGKTYYQLSIVKSFLASNLKAEAAIFDSEGAITSQMLTERNIDTSRVAVIGVATIQEFRTQCIKIIEEYEKIPEEKRNPLLLVLDSLGMLSSTKEMEDTAKGEETKDMTKAPLIKGIFRVLTLRLSKLNVPMIVTNHVYDVIGAYVPMKEQGGGKGLKYAASTIIFLGSSKEKEGTEVVGNIIKCTVKKSRFTKLETVGHTLLRYDTGLDKYYGLQELAVEAGIWKESGNRVELQDGTKVFGKKIKDDPETYFTEDVLKLIDEYVGTKYKYGSAVKSEESEDNG